MHLKHHLHLLPSILISLVLSSCQILQISPTLGRKPDNNSIIPARNTSFSLKSDGSNQPEMLTFPLLVPLQPMTPVQTLPKGKVYDVNLTTSTGKLQNDQIRIPANGAFKVSYQSGQHSRIIDNDASLDGLAVVEIPAGIYVGHIGAEVSGNSKLTVEDKLYYQKQEFVSGGISPIEQNGKKPTMQFYQVGNRQTPTPSSWFSPDGPNLILSFSNQNVNQAMIRWSPTSNAADFPTGIKEIGVQGGTIELADLAILDIPPGALNQKTVVTMRQILTTQSREISCPFPDRPDECFPGWVFVSPIIKIEPLGLSLTKPASLKIGLYKEAYYHAPFEIKPLGSLTLDEYDWNAEDFFAPSNITSLNQVAYDDTSLLNVFANVSRQALGPRILPHNEATFFKASDSDIFKITNAESSSNQIDDKCTPHYKITDHFVIKDQRAQDIEQNCLRYPDISLMNAGKYLEAAYDYYVNTLKLKEAKAYPVQYAQNINQMEVQLNTYIPNQKGGLRNANGLADAKLESGKTKNDPMIYKGHILYLNSRADGDGTDRFNTAQEADTTAHELFHAFQDARFENNLQFYNFSERYFIEGSAAFIGNYTLSKNISLMGFESPSNLDNFLSSTSYPGRIDSLNYVLDTELFRINDPSGMVSPYDTASLWTYLSNKYATPKMVSDIISEFDAEIEPGKKLKDSHRSPTPRLHVALNRILNRNNSSFINFYNSSFINFYTEYSKSAYFKEKMSYYNLKQRFGLFRDLKLQHVTLKKNPENIGEDNTKDTPVTIKDTVVKSMTTKYFTIQGDETLSEETDIKVCLEKNLLPESISVVDGRVEKKYASSEFIRANIVGVRNQDGLSKSIENDVEVSERTFPEGEVDDFEEIKLGECVLVPKFGASGSTKSIVIALSNANWYSTAHLPIQAKLIAYNTKPKLKSLDKSTFEINQPEDVKVDGKNLDILDGIASISAYDLSDLPFPFNFPIIEYHEYPITSKAQDGAKLTFTMNAEESMLGSEQWLYGFTNEAGFSTASDEEDSAPEPATNKLSFRVKERTMVAVPSNCGFPCRGPITELNATMSWPGDPYPYSFPNRHSGASLTLDSPDLYSPWSAATGMDYSVTNMEYGQDADGNAIVTRLNLSFLISGGNNNNIEPFSRTVSASSISMVSTDGKEFKLEPNVPQQVGGMGYGYGYNGDLLSAYSESRCNPSVAGDASNMSITGGSLTMQPPSTGNYGSATFSITLSGQTRVSTNSTFYCYAAREIDGNTINYGHKNTLFGNGTASATMKVGVWFEER